MTDGSELAHALTSLASVFASLGVTWAVGGSLASAAHGEPRATNDVDIIAVMTDAEARRFVAQLGPNFYADADAAADAARRKASFNIIDTRSFLKIDIFIPPKGPLGTGQLDRRQVFELMPPAPAVPVLAPEDVVLQKLRWFQLGGEVSDRQWRDIVAVLRASKGKLDERYLDETAKATALDDLLARARRDALA